MRGRERAFIKHVGGMLCLIAGIWTALYGCQCSGEEVLAELVEQTGSIQRDFAAKVAVWQGAEIGDEFRVGDGIRSKKASEAVLRLSGDAYVRLTEESIIRFLEVKARDKKKATHGINVETGEAQMVVGESEVVLVTNVGMATLEAGTRINLRRSDIGMEFRVEIGQATFYDKDNKPNVVKEGDGILVDIGSAVLERLTDAPEATDESAAAADTGQEGDTGEDEIDTGPESGEAHRQGGGGSEDRQAATIGGGPDYADFSVTAGTSFVLHVARPPAAVELRFDGKCDGEAAIEDRKRLVSKGTGSANMLLKTGRHVYRVRCLDPAGHPAREVVAKGSILVLRDSGAARLPRSAASSFVETDGRRYKVMYQTRIPNISVRWPQAPKGQKYVLHISSKRGKKQIKTRRPEYAFKSGALSEGVHEIKFEAIGNLARTSKTTTVDIRFDNAAPKASILTPKEGGFQPGSRVAVSGVAMADWDVSLVGGQVDIDAEHRFTGEVVHLTKYKAIALRLTHKRRGIHYYLRRASGQAQ
jgi:hypothetical protein